ncbi:MAG TPA: DUF1491 family protein [Sphingomonas sp.]|uniref:DUF1491 family protein n=1 Tax=Sphingomonas sp. TaxID=28214 RepID=UPI002BB4C924|nr:DUF1491 family protein [Sphingomonas sp.]HMI19915.1 DUF1491 family protein [Sphingomonas sp.]
MAARLAAGMLVSALIRRAEELGGNGAVLAKGDVTAGALLIQLADRGVPGPLLERRLDPQGAYRWSPTGPEDVEQRGDYIARRRRSDPDLWVLELDVPNGLQLVEAIAG